MIKKFEEFKLSKKSESINEDWGSSDQSIMNQQIHKELGEPETMPMPFDEDLRRAVQSAVDFHWDEWPEYQQDPQALYDQATRYYLRAYFREKFDNLVKMFEPKQ
jgi:hypothetical protein